MKLALITLLLPFSLCSASSLIWQDDVAVEKEELLYSEAMNYCKNLEINSQTDWRLPTINELLTTVDYSRYDPASLKVFEYGLSKRYWSSTLYAKDKERAWYVDFISGASQHHRHSYALYVRCVRDGK